MDVLTIGIGISLFLLSWLLVRLCDSVGSSRKDDTL